MLSLPLMYSKLNYIALPTEHKYVFYIYINTYVCNIYYLKEITILKWHLNCKALPLFDFDYLKFDFLLLYAVLLIFCLMVGLLPPSSYFQMHYENSVMFHGVHC